MLWGGLIALGTGVLFLLLFRIWFLIKAFQHSAVTGLLSFLLPGIGDLIFLLSSPGTAARPFLAQIVALLIAGGGGWIAYNNGADREWVTAQMEQLSSRTTAEPGVMEEREKVMVLETKAAKDAARLQTLYTELNTTLAKLNKNDPAAVEAYNAQAKAYQEQKNALDSLRSDLTRRQAQLQKQIDAKSPQPIASTTPSVPSAPAKTSAGPPGEIIVFVRKGNPAVTMGRAYLSGRRLSYREIDVDESEENRKEWNRYSTVIPTFVINGQVVSGYVRSELDRLIPPEEPLDAF